MRKYLYSPDVPHVYPPCPRCGVSAEHAAVLHVEKCIEEIEEGTFKEWLVVDVECRVCGEYFTYESLPFIYREDVQGKG